MKILIEALERIANDNLDYKQITELALETVQKAEQQWTVILMYPDYYCDQYGETWCGSVQATGVDHAIFEARSACLENNPELERADDLLPVSVFRGQHEDLIGEWTMIKVEK